MNAGERINPWRMWQGSFIPNWMLRRTEMSHGAKLVYGRLAQYAGKKGKAFPFVRTLAHEVGIEARQTRKYLGELVDLKLLEVEYHREDGKASSYWFLGHPWMYDEDEDEGECEVDHRHDHAAPTGTIMPPLRHDYAAPTGTILPVSKRVREKTQETDSGNSPRSFAPLTHDGDPSADPASSKVTTNTNADEGVNSAERVGAGGTNSDTTPVDASGASVDKGPKWSRKVLRDAEVRRLSQAHQANQRASGEQGMAASRVQEERVKNLKGKDGKASVRAVLIEMEKVWHKGFAKLFPGVVTMPWGVPERKLLTNMMLGPEGKGGYGDEVVMNALKYVLLEWSALRARFFRGNGMAPSVGFLSKYHSLICVEAQRWVALMVEIKKYDAWKAANPTVFNPPPELAKAHTQALDDLESLRGLKKQYAAT